MPQMTRDELATGRSAGEHSNRARTAAAAALGVAGEAAVLLGAFSTDVSIAMIIGLHLMTLAAVSAVLLLRRHPGNDETMAILTLVIIAVAGPAGAIAALASLPFAGASDRGRDTLAAWYRRLSGAGRVTPSAAMLDRIASGRVQRPDAPTPENFLHIVATGSLEQRQRALGLIARQFHPDYAPVLDAALRSSEPVVRVQASAVVARVREDLKARVARLASQAESGDRRAALRRVSELSALATCTLVESAERARCARLIEEALSELLKQDGDIVGTAVMADRLAQAAVETFLIRHQKFRELRVARRAGAIASRPGIRIRRLAPAGAL